MAKNKNSKNNNFKKNNIEVGDNSPENINNFVDALIHGKLNKEDIEAFLSPQTISIEQIGQALIEAIKGHKEISLKIQDSLQQIINAINQMAQDERSSQEERDAFAKYLYNISQSIERMNKENNRHNESIVKTLATAVVLVLGFTVSMFAFSKSKNN